MSTYERIRLEKSAAVCTVTLNRPEKRNALDETTIVELKRGFAEAEQDAAVRVIVLRGAGPDFCAGADLSQLERIAATSDPLANLEDASSLGELLIAMRVTERAPAGARRPASRRSEPSARAARPRRPPAPRA